MRLYTRTGATALDDPEYGHFDADEQGGFDLPDGLSDRLHAFHWRGQPMWETDIERQHRLNREDVERRKDPATLLSVVEQLMRAAQAASQAPAPVAAVEVAKEQAPTKVEDADAPAEKAPRAPRKTAAARRTPKAE
jgi:hypothetical protein